MRVVSGMNKYEMCIFNLLLGNLTDESSFISAKHADLVSLPRSGENTFQPEGDYK